MEEILWKKNVVGKPFFHFISPILILYTKMGIKNSLNKKRLQTYPKRMDCSLFVF